MTEHPRLEMHTEFPQRARNRIARLEAELACAEGREAPEGWHRTSDGIWDWDNEDHEGAGGVTIHIEIRWGTTQNGYWRSPYACVADMRNYPHRFAKLSGSTVLACIEAAQAWLIDQRPCLSVAVHGQPTTTPTAATAGAPNER